MGKQKNVKLPNFLIAGAAKSGTTSLYYYLKQHPEIFMCSPKEPQFFLAQFARLPMNGIGDNKKNFVKNFHDYCKLFEKVTTEKAIGEASWSNRYYYEKTIPLIKKYLGNPRIIIMLRNPVERALSAHSNLIRQGREWLSFEKALEEEDKRRRENWRHCWFYKDPGFYYKQVKAYITNFSDVKIFLFDEFQKDSLSIVQDIYEFLGIDTSFIPDTYIRLNVSGIPKFKLFGMLMRPGKLQKMISRVSKLMLTEKVWFRLQHVLKSKCLIRPEMKSDTKQYLIDTYREDILQLQTLLDRDLSHWLQNHN